MNTQSANGILSMGKVMKAMRKKVGAFLNGMASTTDIFGVAFLDEANRVSQRSDLEAMQGDWIAVGEDIKVAMSQYVKETSRPESDS